MKIATIIIGSIVLAICYKVTKPYFRKEDPRLKDWVKKQRQKQKK